MAAREVSERQVFTITVVVVCAVLLGLCVLAFLSYNSYSQLVEEKAGYGKKIDDHVKVIAKRDQLKAEMESLEAAFANVKKYLPTDREVAELLNALTAKCIEAKLDVIKLQVSKQSAAGAGRRGQAVMADAEKIVYQGEFGGSFHATARFVSMIENWENFKRFVSITDLKLSAAEGGLAYETASRPQPHKVTMTLEFYKYQEPRAKPAGPAGAAARTPVKPAGAR